MREEGRGRQRGNERRTEGREKGGRKGESIIALTTHLNYLSIVTSNPLKWGEKLRLLPITSHCAPNCQR